MTLEQARALNELQKTFEDDPTAFNAYKLFRELNKYDMFLTVIRLYWKHDLNKKSLTAKQVQLMRSQYEYAKDHLEMVKKASRGKTGDNSSQDGENDHWSINALGTIIRLTGSILIILCFAGIISRENGSEGPFSALNEKNFGEFLNSEDIDTRLDEVKGIDEIKGEIEDLIKMIKNSEEYTSKGAKMAKGVLLFGKPGTGKTLLSRAIAGEAGVNFLYCTGSQFDEMYVGVGASRVRKLFQQARKNKPCIIFIDEIDSLLSASRRFGGEHSSSRATINQMLTELDGFQKNEGILVIGATNHEDALDPAAVRPGRFDKKINVPSPDVNGRQAIFEMYLDKIKHEEVIEPKKLATMTPGFTGAEIENLVNTAILEAVHKGKFSAGLADFEHARDRIMMGIERKKLSMSEKERLNTAIHEAGHTVACFFTQSANKLYKATIVARGGSLGATFMVPSESDSLAMNKEKVLAQIDVAMGGHVAEELFIGRDKVTTGCGSDLQNATKYAYMAVEKFGMFGEDAGYISTDKNKQSQERLAMIDKKVQEILKESKERVEKLLKKHEKVVRDISVNLYKYDYLDQKDIEEICEGKQIEKEKVREFDAKVEEYQIRF